MKALILRVLRALLAWLEPPGALVILSVPVDAVLDRARVLTAAQEQIPDRSGEAKRHQVYAQLIKEFPDRSRRKLAQAIEAAVAL